jgi:kynurenine formamidase
MTRGCLTVVVLACVAAGCATAPATPFPSGRLVDLTHPFDEDTIYWPTSPGFEIETVSEGVTDRGHYYLAKRFRTAEHGGTHIDAPIHFFENGVTVDAIALEHLVGPGIVVDVRKACEDDPDYQVGVDDFLAWEQRHGPIPSGAIVLLSTGFGKFWPDRVRYMGTDARGPDAVSDLHFPGLHPDTARWLMSPERAIRAVGLDTPSIDHGPSVDFETHVTLFGRNIPAFENVANLDELPATGFTVVALPMKIGGGSGAPLRIIAIVP